MRKCWPMPNPTVRWTLPNTGKNYPNDLARRSHIEHNGEEKHFRKVLPIPCPLPHNKAQNKDYILQAIIAQQFQSPVMETTAPITRCAAQSHIHLALHSAHLVCIPGDGNESWWWKPHNYASVATVGDGIWVNLRLLGTLMLLLGKWKTNQCSNNDLHLQVSISPFSLLLLSYPISQYLLNMKSKWQSISVLTMLEQHTRIKNLVLTLLQLRKSF